MFDKFKANHGGLGPIQYANSHLNGGYGLLGRLGQEQQQKDFTAGLDQIANNESLSPELRTAAQQAHKQRFSRDDANKFLTGLMERANDETTIGGSSQGIIDHLTELKAQAMTPEDENQVNGLRAAADYSRRLALSGNPQLQQKGLEGLASVVQGYEAYNTKNEEQKIQLNTRIEDRANQLMDHARDHREDVEKTLQSQGFELKKIQDSNREKERWYWTTERQGVMDAQRKNLSAVDQAQSFLNSNAGDEIVAANVLGALDARPDLGTGNGLAAIAQGAATIGLGVHMGRGVGEILKGFGEGKVPTREELQLIIDAYKEGSTHQTMNTMNALDNQAQKRGFSLDETGGTWEGPQTLEAKPGKAAPEPANAAGKVAKAVGTTAAIAGGYGVLRHPAATARLATAALNSPWAIPATIAGAAIYSGLSTQDADTNALRMQPLESKEHYQQRVAKYISQRSGEYIDPGSIALPTN